ncbi:MAG: hypothetical protein FWE64_03455 [Alphaproteobacteria bacterium]|nr:hypothetical protein [Alphaproteobacteria bacterium]
MRRQKAKDYTQLTIFSMDGGTALPAAPVPVKDAPPLHIDDDDGAFVPDSEMAAIFPDYYEGGDDDAAPDENPRQYTDDREYITISAAELNQMLPGDDAAKPVPTAPLMTLDNDGIPFAFDATDEELQRKKAEAQEMSFMGGDTKPLAGRNIAPLVGDCFYFIGRASVTDDHAVGRPTLSPKNDDDIPHFVHIILFRDARDNKKYFLDERDDFQDPYPFDTMTFWRAFDSDDRRRLGPFLERFTYKGRDIFEGIKLDPWYIDKGEIKSFFKVSFGEIHYKSGGRKFYLRQSEEYEIPHEYEYYIEQKYGTKIKEAGGPWYYNIHSPADTIFLGNITSYNPAFLDIISYEAVYSKAPLPFHFLKKTVLRMMMDVISKNCGVDKNKIWIPHKAIACVFKHDYDYISHALDGPRKTVYTKKGKVSKAKQEQLSPGKDVFPKIELFARYINRGDAPGADFYDCNICAAEKVCVYKTVATRMRGG